MVTNLIRFLVEHLHGGLMIGFLLNYLMHLAISTSVQLLLM